MKTFSIYIPIYGQDVIISYNCSSDEFIKHWKKKVSKNEIDNFLEFRDFVDDFKKGTSNAKFAYKEGSHILIILLRPIKDKLYFQSIVLHEVCHLVFYLLDKRGLPFTLETDESYTYLIQYVYREIMRNLSTV